MCPSGEQMLASDLLDQLGSEGLGDLILCDEPGNSGIGPMGSHYGYHKKN